MSTDFFDDDLVSSGRPPDERAKPQADVPATLGSDLNLGQLARQKRELDGRVAGAVREIEELRSRQGALEDQKGRLQDLARRQTAYEEGKRENIEKLDRSVILLEKERLQATRMRDLLSEMIDRFREALEEITSIDEETWSSDDFDEELARALVRVEEAGMLHQKGIARIEAAGWQRGTPAKQLAAMRNDVSGRTDKPQGFGYWLKAGLAFSLPLIIVATALFVAYLYLVGIV